MNKNSTIHFGLSIKQHRLILNTISDFNQIEKVIIFGSRAKGNYRPGSDIDLALFGDKLSSIFINRFLSALDDLPLPFMFDVVHYDKIKNELLKNKIDSEGKILFERKLNTV